MPFYGMNANERRPVRRRNHSPREGTFRSVALQDGEALPSLFWCLVLAGRNHRDFRPRRTYGGRKATAIFESTRRDAHRAFADPNRNAFASAQTETRKASSKAQKIAHTRAGRDTGADRQSETANAASA